VPSIAAAACSAPVRADSLATQRVLAAMRARGAAGVDDASALYARAQRSCSDLGPARAIVTATNRYGVPAVGRRTRVLGIDLVGVPQAGSAAWRLDLVRNAGRADRGPVAARRRARSAIDAAGFGSLAITWSVDPTRLAWDADQQSSVAATLARSADPALHGRAARGVRAFAVGARGAVTSRMPLLQQLTIARRLAVAAGSDGAASRVARSIALRTYARVRSTRSRGWSRIAGAWSTARQHRALVAGAVDLLARVPHARTRLVVDDLRAALTTRPHVTFRTVPSQAFYPWPRDGALDSSEVVLDIDKPATVTLLVYAPDGALVRTVTAAPDAPGEVRRGWDGARTDGTVVDAGEYRYNVDARDLVGNRIRVPGLEAFTVARDTTPPRVDAASMRVVGTGSSRRAIVSWDVDEPLSPVVRSWLVLRNGTKRTSIKLHDSAQKLTVRRSIADLAPGTWTGLAVFIDGSGNRAQRSLGSVQLR
jgi:hypothetical protein